MIGQGLPNKKACEACGIDESTFYRWLREGEKESKANLKNQLNQSIKKASANFELTHLTNIKKFSNEDWKASAWLLERRNPNEYSLKNRGWE